MSQNEQAPKKNSGNDSDVSKTENENKDEINASNDEEVSQTESNSTTSTSSRAPPKRASASVKSHPSHSSRGAPSFESQMTPEQIETNLIKLFGNNFPDAAKDNIVLSDGLSVRDLRIIVRVLKLCGPSQVNVRKPLLCDFLMKHMQTEHMTESYRKFTEEKERARLARQKSREEKTKHTLETQSQNTNSAAKETPIPTTSTGIATTRSQARHNMNEKLSSNSTDRRSTQQNQRSATTREKQSVSSNSGGASSYSNTSQSGINLNAPGVNSNMANHIPTIIPLPGLAAAASIVVNLGGAKSNANINSASLLNPGNGAGFDNTIAGQNPTNQVPQFAKTRYVKEVTLPRLKYDESFDMKKALDILQECNNFVLMVSDRLTEMERALSIMTFKIAELEKII